jgi:hypothetical protein
MASSISNINYDTIDSLFKTISINYMLLFIRYLLFNFLGANPDNHPKEDSKFFTLKKNPNEDRAFRLNKISENDTTNMSYDIIVFFGAFIMNCFGVLNKKGESEAIALMVLISVYTFFRISFSLCYLFALQPWRTICFVFTKTTTMIACCIMISLSFKIEFAQFAK